MTLYVICLGELTNHKMQVIFHLVYCLLAEKYLAKITWLVFVLLHYFPLMNASQLGKLFHGDIYIDINLHIDNNCRDS